MLWRIVTTGEREFAKLMATAGELGLRNELQGFTRPVCGYDALLLEAKVSEEA